MITFKFLPFVLAFAPIVVSAQTLPEKCRHLDVTAYNLDWASGGDTLVVDAVIKNDDRFGLGWASFSFNLYLGENEKVGQVYGTISSLASGDEVHLRMPTRLRQIDNVKIWSVNCNFVQ